MALSVSEKSLISSWQAYSLPKTSAADEVSAILAKNVAQELHNPGTGNTFESYI